MERFTSCELFRNYPDELLADVSALYEACYGKAKRLHERQSEHETRSYTQEKGPLSWPWRIGAGEYLIFMKTSAVREEAELRKGPSDGPLSFMM